MAGDVQIMESTGKNTRRERNRRTPVQPPKKEHKISLMKVGISFLIVIALVLGSASVVTVIKNREIHLSNLYDKSNVLKKNIDPSTYKFLSPVMDITFDSVTPTADDPVRVTFVANNMTDNIQVDILYYCPEHGWEVLQGEKISDNQVAAYFHAGSSVMALIYRETGATVGTSQVSPQTGARSTWPIAVSAIFFVSFGIFALYKSKKA